MPKIETAEDIEAVLAARRGGSLLYTTPQILTPEYVRQVNRDIAKRVQAREGYQAQSYEKAGQVRFGG